MDKFFVKLITDKVRITENEYKLTFVKTTVVEKTKCDCIPKDIFKFVDFVDISEGKKAMNVMIGISL